MTLLSMLDHFAQTVVDYERAEGRAENKYARDELHAARRAIMEAFDARSASAEPAAITKEMVNAAWNRGKELRMTGLPSDFQQVLAAALTASPPAPTIMELFDARFEYETDAQVASARKMLAEGINIQALGDPTNNLVGSILQSLLSHIDEQDLNLKTAIAVGRYAAKASPPASAPPAAGQVLGALQSLIVESGGKAIPNESLTIARDNAIAALAAAPQAAPEQEPVAWLAEGAGWKRVFLDMEAAQKLANEDGHLVPLYASPPASKREAELVKALKDARFGLEATEACLKTWNGGRGSPVNVEGILERIDTAIRSIEQE